MSKRRKNNPRALSLSNSEEKIEIIGEHYYHYCIVRNDLPIGVAAAQLVHAAGETGGNLTPGTRSVVLGVNHQDDLQFISFRLSLKEIPHKLIIESEEPYQHQLMAIGIFPVRGKEVLKCILGKLNVYSK